MLHDERFHQKHVQIIIEHLVSRCRWDSKRLLRAAEKAQSFAFRYFLKRYAGERARFADELQSFAPGFEDLGEQTEPIVQRRARSMNSDVVLIQECLEKEDDLLYVYEDALLEDLPENLRRVIAKQAARIVETCEMLNAVKRTEIHVPNISPDPGFAHHGRSNR